MAALLVGGACILDECLALVGHNACGMDFSTDQWIQIVNAAGTWVAGIGTLAAVIVSLWLARRSIRVRLEVRCRVYFVEYGKPVQLVKCIAFRVANLGERAVAIEHVGWAVGRRKSVRRVYFEIDDRLGPGLPRRIEPGDAATFMSHFDDGLMPHLAKVFVQDAPVGTLKAYAAAESGAAVEVKPDAELVRQVTECVNKLKRNSGV